MSGPAHCAWCGTAFTPRATGGAPQRFCSTPHRRAWNGLREQIGEQILTAIVTGRPDGELRRPVSAAMEKLRVNYARQRMAEGLAAQKAARAATITTAGVAPVHEPAPPAPGVPAHG